MSVEQILPGLEGDIARMERSAMSEDDIEKLPTFTAERVANYEPKRYALAARLLFAENISRRTICKWLHMSPNTLAAIEKREIILHPELVQHLQSEANAEIIQLKRMGREALRALFFDKKAMGKTSAKELASILKTLDEISEPLKHASEPNRNTKNDYIEAISEWSESDRFGAEKNSAPAIARSLEVAAPRNAPEHAGTTENEPGSKSDSQ